MSIDARLLPIKTIMALVQVMSMRLTVEQIAEAMADGEHGLDPASIGDAVNSAWLHMRIANENALHTRARHGLAMHPHLLPFPWVFETGDMYYVPVIDTRAPQSEPVFMNPRFSEPAQPILDDSLTMQEFVIRCRCCKYTPEQIHSALAAANHHIPMDTLVWMLGVLDDNDELSSRHGFGFRSGGFPFANAMRDYINDSYTAMTSGGFDGCQPLDLRGQVDRLSRQVQELTRLVQRGMPLGPVNSFMARGFGFNTEPAGYYAAHTQGGFSGMPHRRERDRSRGPRSDAGIPTPTPHPTNGDATSEGQQ